MQLHLKHNRNFKGKISLSDKIDDKNNKASNEHKETLLTFFENLKKQFVDKKNMEKTYEDFIECKYPESANLCYDNVESTSISEDINKYSELVKNTYLKNGLTEDEAQLRIARDGKNILPEKENIPWVIQFIQEITSVFSILLWIGGILSIIAYGIHIEDTSNLYLAIVLWLVVLISSGFTLSQNLKSEAILKSFKSFSTSKARIIRDGLEKRNISNGCMCWRCSSY